MAASRASTHPDSSSSSIVQPLEVVDFYEVIIKRKQRIPKQDYFLGYREGTSTVFRQELRSIDLPAFVKFINSIL